MMNGKQLKNSILQWAIQGKLVPQDPNDEPASVLLDRIRQEKARLVKEKKIKKDKNESIIYRGEDNSYYEKFLATGEVKCIDDEIPFEIPVTWEWVRLTYITYLIEDCPHSTAKDEGKGYPLVRTPNIGFGRLSLNCVHRVSETVYNQRNVRAVPQTNDLIFAREAPAGNIAVIQEGEKVCLGQRTVLIRPFTQYILSDYLAYYILAPSSQQNLVDKSSGTTVPHVNLSDFRRYLIALPPIKEQHNIIDKISMVLPWIEKYGGFSNELQNLNIGINDLLKKSILQEAIQGRLVPQFSEEGTAQELLEQIRQEKQKLIKEGKLKNAALSDSVIYKGDDNKYWEKKDKTEKNITDEIPFEIPDSWVWVRHNDLFDISGGSQPPKSKFIEREKEGYIRLFQIRDYGPNPQPIYIPLSTASKISQKGDILLARYGASLGKVFYAEYGAYNVALAKVIPLYESPLIFQKYIYLYYCSSIYQNEIVNRSRCAQAGFNKEDLNSLLFPLPPLAEQCRIVEMYEKAIASIMRV